MKAIFALVAALLASASALANPALHGTWSAASVNGRPLKVEFAADKSGKINGQPMRWDTLGGALFIQQNGQTAAYGFKVEGDRLNVSGGDLKQPATLTKGTGAYDKAIAAVAPAKAGGQSSSGNGQELVANGVTSAPCRTTPAALPAWPASS